MGAEFAEELRRRSAEQPGLAAMTAMYQDLLSLESSIEQDLPLPAVSQEDLQARLSRRVPALAPEDVREYAPLLRRHWDRVCAITLRHRADLNSRIEEIRVWAGMDGNLERMAEQYLRGELDLISQEAGLDLSLLQFLINHTLHPLLRRYAQALAPFIDRESWYQPYCPVCGGEPDFAVLSKPHGARRLLCSRCDFEWPYRRTSCPFCGCEDPEQYQYVPSDDNIYRLYLCDHCHRYLKTLDEREVLGERLLPVERIVTLPMDIAAHQAGYGV